MYQNPKSSTVAGLLGIFLGAFGAHNWYLGEKGKGIAHVCMAAAGLLVEILAYAILPNVMSWSMLFTWASILSVLSAIAALAISGTAIWGLVEGIMILVAGDAGLAARGYPVATPVMPQGNYGSQGNYSPQGYGPNNYNNYNNNYGPQNGYNQMPNQNNQNNYNSNMNNNMSGNQNQNNSNNFNNDNNGNNN